MNYARTPPPALDSGRLRLLDVALGISRVPLEGVVASGQFRATGAAARAGNAAGTLRMMVGRCARRMCTTVHHRGPPSVSCCYLCRRSGDGVAEGADAGDLDA